MKSIPGQKTSGESTMGIERFDCSSIRIFYLGNKPCLSPTQKTGNRHLVDVRSVESFPPMRVIEGVQVLTPAELIASKVISHYQRLGKSKSWTDRRDLVVLLLAFPELKRDPGPVTDCLGNAKASQNVLAIWRELVAQELSPETDDDDF
jgi:hypothetical protein